MKHKFSISVGDRTANIIRTASEELELNISSFITLLVNNWEKEQKAMQMMDNMKELKKMMENVEHGAKGITGTNKEEN